MSGLASGRPMPTNDPTQELLTLTGMLEALPPESAQRDIIQQRIDTLLRQGRVGRPGAIAQPPAGPGPAPTLPATQLPGAMGPPPPPSFAQRTPGMEGPASLQALRQRVR